MDSTILKALERWEFPVIAALGGIGAIYLSFFKGVPTASNQWAPELRIEVHWPLLAVGILLISLAFSLRLLDVRSRRSQTPMPQVPNEPLAEAEELPEEPEDHPAVRAYRRLTGTQKEVVVFRYDDCSTHSSIDLDRFFERFNQKNDKKIVTSIDEMYYRLRDLEHAGLIRLKGVAPRATSIGKTQGVALALSRAKVIVTAGTKAEEEG